MRILFLTRSLDAGGAERQLVLLAVGLTKRGHRVAVATFYSGGALQHELLDGGVEVLDLGKRGRWDLIGFFIRLLRLIKKEKPEILHSYLPVANIFAVFAKIFLPEMKYVWGVRASEVHLHHYDVMTRVAYALERVLARFADKIIVNSQAGFDHAARGGFPVDRMVVVPNGIDTDKFRPDIEARERVRREWGMKPGDIVIGLVARFDPIKGHETFIRAAAIMKEINADCRFICVGGGPTAYERGLREFAVRLGVDGRISWYPARRDMCAVYNGLDIFSCTSLGEGFPNVVGEAMACCVPCVVTDVGDCALLVGNSGVVVPAADPGALSNGWLEAIGKMTELRSRTRQIIEARYSVERLVTSTESLLAL